MSLSALVLRKGQRVSCERDEGVCAKESAFQKEGRGGGVGEERGTAGLLWALELRIFLFLSLFIFFFFTSGGVSLPITTLSIHKRCVSGNALRLSPVALGI